MRAWLYDTLATFNDLAWELGVAEEELPNRINPRRSETTIPSAPFVIIGMGYGNNEDLIDSTSGEVNPDRQYFQVWVHDDGNSFARIDRAMGLIRARLTGASSKEHGVVTINYLETSGEFGNQTYRTNFRYLRFQAIIVQGR